MNKTPIAGIYLVLLTLSLGLGTFIQVLDSSIANVSISYIAGDLAVSPSQATWVITSFAISNGIVLALTGWLSTRFGQVNLFIWSTTLFSITSWLCGLAWNLPMIVFFRVLQGASAGALIPLSQALLLTNYPEGKQGTALGFWAMIVIVAPILGPVLGGYLTDNYGWPWIFYINIPIGFFSAWMTWFLIKNRETEIKKTPIDLWGLILLTFTVSSLQIVLDKGNDLGWLGSNFIRILIIVSISSFVYFIVWNLSAAYPIIDFSLFRDRNFVVGTLLGALGYLMFFGSTVLLPLWLETQLNYTAFWSGLALMPIGFFPLFFSTFVGKYVNRVDPRWMTTFSFLTFSITFFWFSQLSSDVSLYKLMLPRFFQGLGLSFFFIPIITITLSSIPAPSLASASGIFNFIRIIAGGGIGTSLYVTLWSRRELFHHGQLVETANPAQPFSTQFYHLLTGLGIEGKGADQLVDSLIAQQAYQLAVNDLFWISGWAFLLLTPLVWLSKPVRLKENAASALH